MKERFEKVLASERCGARFRNVVESMQLFYEKRGSLTEGQIRYFESIESNVLPDEAWETELHRCKCGKTLFLLRNITRPLNTLSLWRIMFSMSETYTFPPRNEYNKMVLNKYAQKAIKAHKEP